MGITGLGAPNIEVISHSVANKFLAMESHAWKNTCYILNNPIYRLTHVD